MNVRLIVLTHGECDTLLNSLLSFSGMVRPHPSSAYLHVDGPTRDGRVKAAAAMEFLSEWNWTAAESDPPLGFCGSCRAGWREAAEGPHEYVFWLEHDFHFVKSVDLRELAAVLDANPRVAQMALMRQPVNDAEIKAGGVVASRPRQFAPRQSESTAWLEQQSFWTTNPSLVRRDFAIHHTWPQGDRCEGRFGLHLKALGYSFGFMGSGEPWVDHVGVRTGFGY